MWSQTLNCFWCLCSGQLDLGCVCENKCLDFETGWSDAAFTGPQCMDSIFSLEDTWSQLNFYFIHDPGLGLPKQVLALHNCEQFRRLVL